MKKSKGIKVASVCAAKPCSNAGTMSCIRCKQVRYCGAACQGLHWKSEHKRFCRALADRTAALADRAAAAAAAAAAAKHEDHIFRTRST